MNLWMPHRFCINNEPWLIVLGVIGNLTIMLAYYSIPVSLIALVQHKTVGAVIGRNVFLMFAAFIFFCGTTHLMDVVTLWFPSYIAQLVITQITAVLSIITAAAIIPISIKLLSRLDNEQRFDAHQAVESANLTRLKEMTR
jgi:hypothetical protein